MKRRTLLALPLMASVGFSREIKGDFWEVVRDLRAYVLLHNHAQVLCDNEPSKLIVGWKVQSREAPPLWRGLRITRNVSDAIGTLLASQEGRIQIAEMIEDGSIFDLR